MEVGADTFDLKRIKLEKIRRAQEEGLRLYEPHPKQEDFHKSHAKERGLFGGNQSGKTYAGCMEVAWTVGKCHPYRENYVGPVFGRDCCVTLNSIRSILIPTYQGLLPRKPCNLGFLTAEGIEAHWPGLDGGTWKAAWNDDDKLLYLRDGSFIEFKSYEQRREAFQGTQRHIIRHDEEPPEDIYGENLARQITLVRNILFTLTPLNYSDWLYYQLCQKGASDPEIDAFYMWGTDNPYANRDTLKALEERISDPAERAARLRGEPAFLSGRIYKEYGEHNFIDPFPIPKDWHKTVIIDPHPDKASAVNIIAEDDAGDLYVTHEGDFLGGFKQVANQVRVLCAGQEIDMWLMDPSALQKARLREQGSIYEEFLKHFPSLIVANNDRVTGINAVREAVTKRADGGAKLRVFKTCEETHFQMSNYMWKKPLASGEDRNKPEVKKKRDDHPDNIRYRVMASATKVGAEDESFGARGYGN